MPVMVSVMVRCRWLYAVGRIAQSRLSETQSVRRIPAVTMSIPPVAVPPVTTIPIPVPTIPIPIPVPSIAVTVTAIIPISSMVLSVPLTVLSLRRSFAWQLTFASFVGYAERPLTIIRRLRGGLAWRPSITAGANDSNMVCDESRGLFA